MKKILIIYILILLYSLQSLAMSKGTLALLSNRSRLVQSTIDFWYKYSLPLCEIQKVHIEFCQLTKAYNGLTASNNEIKKLTSGEIPGFHLPKDKKPSDLLALNWFPNAFSTASSHEKLIYVIILNSLSRSALEKAIKAAAAVMDSFPTDSHYNKVQGPNSVSYLKYFHPFLQSYIIYEFNKKEETQLDLNIYYQMLYEKKPIFEELKYALTSQSEYKVFSKLDQLRQVYQLNNFIRKIRKLSLKKQIEILENPKLLTRIEGFLDYMYSVKSHIKRPAALSNLKRVQIYRSIILLDEVLEIFNENNEPKTHLPYEYGENEVFNDFMEPFVLTQEHFTGVENEMRYTH